VSTLQLDTPVQYVKGVGPVRARQLSELGIHTVEDLLTYFPRRHDLRRQAQPIETLCGDESSVTVAGTVTEIRNQTFGRRPFFQCTLDDGTGWVTVKWFHGNYLAGRIRPDSSIAVSGRPRVYRSEMQLINPQWQPLFDASQTDLRRDELQPVYPSGAGLSSAVIAKITRTVLPQVRSLVRPWFDASYLVRRGLLSRPAAIAAMHRPEDRQHWAEARRRVAYDECLLMQLGIARRRMTQLSRPARRLRWNEQIDRRIRARFPFTLTGAQDRVVREIVTDLARRRPMNRLLQGDVGSGKTVVALYAGLTAVASRTQVAIMTPTEILATQHYRKIQAYLAGSQVRTALLVGGQSATQRRETLDRLAGGEIDIVVGTHALIGETVRFAKLGLVVVDEQHKFGVRQRGGIRGKGYAPHYLVMTATPIPRTLAMTVFGDLDVSIIDALPPGRGKTQTRLVGPGDWDEEMDFVRSRLADGQQAYFICPLVTASGQTDLTSAEQLREELAAGPLCRFHVGLIHGQMPVKQKEAAMEAFRSGAVQALVASVVVEVGLDIPSANVMVVLHAERFGLAQLHQLRGRIGRAAEEAVCILVARAGNPLARRRLEVLTQTDDGFAIAEEDLRLRGPGEFFGTRQHGLPELKVADLAEDLELLRLARKDAFRIIDEDPDLSAPHHQQLRRHMRKAYQGRLGLLDGA